MRRAPVVAVALVADAGDGGGTKIGCGINAGSPHLYTYMYVAYICVFVHIFVCKFVHFNPWMNKYQKCKKCQA